MSQASPAKADQAALLDAVLALTGDLELGDVLERIVASAATLTGARYAALGVVGTGSDAHQLVEFHHRGMSADEVAAQPRPPHGDGVLGVLLDDPQSLRLSSIGDHPAAVGFPPGHPPMRTFLGVPVRIRGSVFGNLYLTDKRAADGSVVEFAAEDESLARGLAAAAGVAIENARLFAALQVQQRWLAAAARVVPRIGADVNAAPALVAAVAWEAAGCRAVGVALPTAVTAGPDAIPTPYDRFVITATAGPDGVALSGVTVVATTVPQQLPLADGTRLVIGCRVRDEPIGALVLDRAEGEWSAEEIELIRAFGDHVTLAAEHALDEGNRRRLAVYTDRDRIARDLHDHVIQRIFAVGLSLQSTLRRSPDAETQERVGRAVSELDTTIAEIRNSIFSLHHVADAGSRSLRAEVLQVVEDATVTLGFEPRVTMTGPIDTAVPRRLHADVLATVRESLSNAARHARASDVSLLVGVDADKKTLIVQVEDNGVGVPEPVVARGGLRSTAERAQAAGGYSTVARRDEPGTTFAWVIPLPD